MYAAVVNTWGSTPEYASITDPAPSTDSQITLKLVATGLHNLVRSRASGNHPSASTLPHVLGVDGVGQDPTTGFNYYFSNFQSGTFSEYVTAPRASIARVPDGVDPATVAGLLNPAMSSWMALATRSFNRRDGFTTLIVGATSASGRIAAQIAKTKGAGRVIGAARNAGALKTVTGLDEMVVLADDPRETDWSSVKADGGGVDVILDYVYGGQTEALLKVVGSTAPGREIEYINIGVLSGEDVSLPGLLLRSTKIAIRGSGLGTWSPNDMAAETDDMVAFVGKLGKEEFGVVEAELKDVAAVWQDASLRGKRVVFLPSV